MKSLRSLLALLVAAGLAAAVLLAGTAMLGNHLQQDAIARALVAKDVGADVLPPPLYLVELRLVLEMAAMGTMPVADAETERARLSNEYEERVTYWRANPPYGLEQQLLGAQHEAGQRFLAAAPVVLKAAASADREATVQALKRAHALYLEHRKGVDETVKSANDFAGRSLSDLDRIGHTVFTAVVAVLLLSLLLLCVIGVWVSRRILRATGGEPDEVAGIANAVAQGDLTVRVKVVAGDQGSVMVAMARMCTNLSGLVAAVRSSGERIATGAQEIAAGNLELSTRTEQQAGSLQQTASAMDEFSGTVRQTAEAAQQATQLARTASEVATRGARVVADVVSTMGEISASSRQIADITSVIDGIAFQTNILALNAAVEAARAGEQGRGFAVVASEVRSLAQRSAAAAKEINTLIGGSVLKVEAGGRLVAEAGTTMDDIVGNVRRVTELIAEIDQATRAQTSGIGLVSQAITQLDAATQRNTALVEESATAAGALSGQAEALLRTVSGYRTAVQAKSASSTTR